MTNRCFCYIRGGYYREYEFTVLLLLSGDIKYIPPKQQKKPSHVEYKLYHAYSHHGWLRLSTMHVLTFNKVVQLK